LQQKVVTKATGLFPAGPFFRKGVTNNDGRLAKGNVSSVVRAGSAGTYYPV
jgi:hypothetical protein